MRILVTGGAGYMGSTLVPMLLGEGHNVRVVDNLLHGGSSLLGCIPRDDFEFMHGDIRDKNTIHRAVDGMDAVVHLAAIVGDPACAREPELARQVNLDASLELFQACQRTGVGQFVFASTCSNYGKMKDSTELVTESSDLRPISLYAECKVGVESSLLDSPSGGGISPTVLRFATLFGVSARMRFDLTVNEFTMELLNNRTLSVYGQQFWRPYVHVRDAARAIATVLDSPKDKVGHEVFNVGATDQNYQKSTLANMIRERVGFDAKIEYVEKEEDPRDYRVSFAKITEALDYRITRTVSDGIEEIIDAINSGIIKDVSDRSYRN